MLLASRKHLDLGRNMEPRGSLQPGSAYQVSPTILGLLYAQRSLQVPTSRIWPRHLSEPDSVKKTFEHITVDDEDREKSV
jgi:hypothetical protein